MKSLRIFLAALLSLTLCFGNGFCVLARPAGGGRVGGSDILARGCDLSFWNVGGYTPDYSLIDFEKMKADGCDFVILRVGYEGTDSRNDTLDTAFLTLYEAAKRAGLGVGVYFYALTTTYEGAAEDAQWCIDLFEHYDLSFEYPIYYDVEDPGNDADRPGHEVLTAEEMTALCLGWAETLEAAGYFPGVYGNYKTVDKLLPLYTSRYDVWYAHVAYAEGMPEFIPEEMPHSSFGGLWQYSWKGSFDGASGELDVNVAYKDYPTLMRKNGYNNVSPVWERSTSVMPYKEAFRLYEYNEQAEGIIETYHTDGTVTMTNNVNSSWAWPSAYLSCYQTVDLKQTPLLTVKKNGTSNFNATMSFETNGVLKNVTLAELAGEPIGEFGAGDAEITANIAFYLKAKGLYPSDGILKLYGITYYVMGAKDSYTTLYEASFVPQPYADWLTSAVYTVGDDIISGVALQTTLRELLAHLSESDLVSVYRADGQRVLEADEVSSGMSVVLAYNGVPLRTYTLSVIGDVNGDGEATTVDARRILGGLLGDAPFQRWQRLSADFDGDGEANTADVRDILLALIK